MLEKMQQETLVCSTVSLVLRISHRGAPHLLQKTCSVETEQVRESTGYFLA